MRLSTVLILGSLLSCKTVPKDATTSQLKFTTQEHARVGNLAFDKACLAFAKVCKLLPQDQQQNETGGWETRGMIHRLDKRVAFSYGDLVAMSGDYYGSAQAVWEDDQVLGFRQDLSQASTRDGRLLYQGAFQLIKLWHKVSSKESLDNPATQAAAFANLPDYSILALTNESHFGWNNMLHYSRYHAQAIQWALAARALEHEGKTNESLERLRQALFFNAFADHFLSDAFAAGHVRVPRRQIDHWHAQKKSLAFEKLDQFKAEVEKDSKAFAKLQNLLGDIAIATAESLALSGNLSKVLHDHDGVLASASGALAVTNSKGMRWRTRVDHELELAGPDAPNFLPLSIVENALHESIEELLAAYTEGLDPTGVYAATLWVPFPDYELEKSLAEKFGKPAPSDLKRYIEEGAFFQKLLLDLNFFGIKALKVDARLTEDRIKEMLTQIEPIMASFRRDIAQDIASNRADCSKRLPEAYRSAFAQIR